MNSAFANKDNQKPKLLVIDDDDNFRNGLLRNLRKVNIDIESRNSAVNIESVIENEDYFLILLDVRMPNVDGFTAAKAIRQVDNAKQTPIIFLSGISTDSNNIHMGVDLGAVDYIFKPYDSDLLVSKIKFFCEKWKREKIEDRYIASVETLNNDLMDHTHNLEKSNKALQSFTQFAAHDIRLPLRQIIETIEQVTKEAQTIRHSDAERLNQAAQNSKHLLSMLDGLLTLNTHENTNFENIDLSTLTASIIDDLESEIKRVSATIHTKTLPSMYGNVQLIHYLLLNLFTNSIQLASPNRALTISIAADETLTDNQTVYRISYIDNNTMSENHPPSNAEKSSISPLFNDQYFENSFGLHIIKQIVEHHKGEISVSFNDDQKRVFSIFIPKSSEENKT